MNILDKIINASRLDLERRQANCSLAELKIQAQRQPSARNMWAYLRRADAPSIAIFGEIKRCSPTYGNIAPIPYPGELAQQYETGGAEVITCVTEPHYFRGSWKDFDEVRAAVEVPILYKDFIVTAYQVWEARAHGADLVILVASALPQATLTGLLERVHALGMEAMVEVHTREEAYRVMEAGARIISVNARSLYTLELEKERVPQVLDVIPPTYYRVVESGISSLHDALEYRRYGVNALMIGRMLIQSSNPCLTMRELTSLGSHPSLNSGS